MKQKPEVTAAYVAEYLATLEHLWPGLQRIAQSQMFSYVTGISKASAIKGRTVASLQGQSFPEYMIQLARMYRLLVDNGIVEPGDRIV